MVENSDRDGWVSEKTILRDNSQEPEENRSKAHFDTNSPTPIDMEEMILISSVVFSDRDSDQDSWDSDRDSDRDSDQDSWDSDRDSDQDGRDSDRDSDRKGSVNT
uniref:Dentin sialophosphoprotein-like n=1 Tax=Caenorhabditis tropicalis TaxID=1561998 RepID=A0A1I7TUW0_9PELO